MPKIDLTTRRIIVFSVKQITKLVIIYFLIVKKLYAYFKKFEAKWTTKTFCYQNKHSGLIKIYQTMITRPWQYFFIASGE
jgi:hypothetical protein